MLINEICSKVGMTRKTIRFYEAEGLLNPERNKNNDYREYKEEDIKRLQLIKFLRELNISIGDIRKILYKEISLTDCLNDRIHKIEQDINDYKKIKDMCLEIIKEKKRIEELDITKYYQEMNILNKKGITMRNVKQTDKEKIKGVYISGGIFALLLFFLIAVISYLQFTELDKMPWIIYIIILLLFGIPLIGMIYNMHIRIKEIKGGEENEASKY